MIKRGLALSLVLGLASIAQADAILEIEVPAGDPCGNTVTAEVFVKQSAGAEDEWIRLIQLNADASDPGLVLSNFQWDFGAVGHYKDEDFGGGAAGVSIAYYYEDPADLGPNPAAQLTLPGDGTRVRIATMDVTVPAGPGPYTLELLNPFGDDDTSSVVAFGFGLDPNPDDDPVTYVRANEFNLDGGTYEFTCGAGDVNLVDVAPLDEKSLWRSANNVVRLTFDGAITAPAAGDVLIREMQAGGAYGADLSGSFTFTVEPGNILKIVESGSVLAHRAWYAIDHNGWAGVAAWGAGDIQYVVQVGDANTDMRVQFNDFAFINAAIPTDPAADDAREDINGDGRVQFNDLAAANSSVVSDTVPKPAGHP